MSSIKHPKPDNKSSQSSNRLLSPHLSVLEALQSTTSNDNNETETNHSLTNKHSGNYNYNYSYNNVIDEGYNPQFNSFENHQNTPTFNEFEFNSSNSWQSITGDYLTSRPTSSVLSSSDTEEDEQYLNDDYHEIESQRLIIESNQTNHSSFNDDSDEKTIEINMNQSNSFNNKLSFSSSSPFKKSSFMETSSFVLPQMFNKPENSFNNYNYNINSSTKYNDATADNSKILIIGHKKQSFLQGFTDHQLRGKFTLDHTKINDYNIILIIFDGLIKIGNILNFIKNLDGLELKRKLFIPIVKNINMKIINKILNNYKINLLCSPINLNDQNELNNLINVLKEDYLLLKDSKSMFPLNDDDDDEDDNDGETNNKLRTFEEQENSYQLIKISSDFEETETSINDQSNQLLPIECNIMKLSSSSSSNQLDRSQDKKIVMIKNTPYEIIHHNHKTSTKHSTGKKSSKKLLKKKSMHRKLLLLGISLSIGIGIGITTALTISFSKPQKVSITSSAPPPTRNNIKKFTKLIISDHLKINQLNSILKQSLINFKLKVSDLSSIMFSKSKNYLWKFGMYWDQFIVSASQGVNNGGLLWLF